MDRHGWRPKACHRKLCPPHVSVPCSKDDGDSFVPNEELPLERGDRRIRAAFAGTPALPRGSKRNSSAFSYRVHKNTGCRGGNWGGGGCLSNRFLVGQGPASQPWSPALVVAFSLPHVGFWSTPMVVLKTPAARRHHLGGALTSEEISKMGFSCISSPPVSNKHFCDISLRSEQEVRCLLDQGVCWTQRGGVIFQQDAIVWGETQQNAK